MSLYIRWQLSVVAEFLYAVAAIDKRAASATLIN